MENPLSSRVNAVSTALLIVIAMGSAWAQVPAPSSPPHRRHHALVYDPVTKRVLVAGGQQLVSNTQTPALDDLWSWDGNRWTQVAPNTGIAMITHKLFADGEGVFAVLPRGLIAKMQSGRWNVVVPDSMTRRESAAGAWDPQRKRFVAFGGLVGGRAYDTSGETWEFDGRAWSRVATSGPPAMFGGAMAYDSKRRVMVLFGGMDTTGRKLGDTWEWNGARWARAASGGPSPRFGAGIAFDSKRGETVVFGGVDSSDKKMNDTWLWDGKSWRRAASSRSPAPRSEGYLAFDDARGVMVMFGGEGTNVVPTLGDTWEWDGVQWQAAGVSSRSSPDEVFAANLGSHAVARYDAETGAFNGIFADSTSGLRNATGLAFGPDGHLYVSSSGNHRILKFDGETGKPLGVFVQDSILLQPFSLIFGPDGNAYVSSGRTSNVLRYEGRTGKYLGVAAGGPELKGPIGLAFGPDGKLYVVNAGGKNVLRYDGTTGTLLGVAARDSLSFASDAAFGPDQMLYVSDATRRSVFRYNPATGDFLDVVVTLPEGSVPVGIAFDAAGRLVIADFRQSRLYRLEKGAKEATLLSSEGMGRPENITLRRR